MEKEKSSVTAPRTIEVEIGGISLRLKSSHDDETVRELARYVDDKIKEALSHTKNQSLQTAALLACLNLAEEMILLKRKARAELERVDAKAQKILSQIEGSQTPRGSLDH